MTGPEHAQRERERLSVLLRQLRADAGMSSRSAAQRAGFSQSKLSKVETGMLLPSDTDVVALCRAYGTSAQLRREVVALVRLLRNEVDSARVILQRGAYRKQQEIGRIEAQTQLFRDFQPTYVLGLLQTADYMRRIFSGTEVEVSRAVDARIARQRVLHDPAKRFHMIMTEGALRWRVGPPELLIGQLDHIADVAKLPNVRLGLIAWTTEANVFPGHAFHMYDDRLAIVGTLTATATIRDPRDVALFADLFKNLDALASYDGEAAEVLDRVRSEYARLT